MHEEYVEVSHVGWGEKIGGSCIGVGLALLILLLSFFLLFWNEGRINQADVVKTAIDISASTNPSAQGKLVTATGPITASAIVGDNLFLLPGKYVVVNRIVEMYAWKEETDTERTKHVGGSETQKTTYTYKSEWTDQPKDSTQFKYSESHRNPAKPFANQVFKVESAQIGRYKIDMSQLNQVVSRPNCLGDGMRFEGFGEVSINLPESGPLPLTAQNSRVSGTAVRHPSFVFQGKGSPETPQIGDVRVCYTVLPVNTTTTAIGKLDQNRIVPFVKDNTPLQRLIPGSREVAIALLNREEQLWRWVLRGLGFLMMWGSLTMIGGPIVAVLDVIPIIGSLAEGVTFVGSFFVALIFAGLTMLVSSLVHHPVALVIAIGVTFATLFVLRRFRPA